MHSTIHVCLTIGNICAAILSWHHSHSILWMIWDCIWSWIYVLYYMVTYGL